MPQNGRLRQWNTASMRSFFLTCRIAIDLDMILEGKDSDQVSCENLVLRRLEQNGYPGSI